jgi:predicted nucleic acid-binding protein
MKVLFDTSALYKRYSEEPGREEVESLLGRASQVVLAAHCRTEIASALCRDLRDKEISPVQYRTTFAAVQGDFNDFEILPINGQVELLAIVAMESSRLRAMDALHIATAQAARVDLFVTADRAQARAAQAVELKTWFVEA